MVTSMACRVKPVTRIVSENINISNNISISEHIKDFGYSKAGLRERRTWVALD